MGSLQVADFMGCHRLARQEFEPLAALRRPGLKRAEEAHMRNGNFSSKAVHWFAIELPISFESVGGSSLQGNGVTVAMSSGAIRFACRWSLPVGGVFRLSIPWPATLPDGAALSLWATGTIQQSERGEVEVAVQRHEFRTRAAGGSKPEIMPVCRAAG